VKTANGRRACEPYRSGRGCVPSDSFRERVPRRVSVGELENDPFLFVDSALNLVAVQKEERFHSGMANPLVPINKRVVHDQRVAQGSGLGDEVG
jgi:hypothetical protein